MLSNNLLLGLGTRVWVRVMLVVRVMVGIKVRDRVESRFH